MFGPKKKLQTYFYRICGAGRSWFQPGHPYSGRQALRYKGIYSYFSIWRIYEYTFKDFLDWCQYHVNNISNKWPVQLWKCFYFIYLFHIKITILKFFQEESVETLSKDPILQCTHKNMEKCHYTYVTYFKPAQVKIMKKKVLHRATHMSDWVIDRQCFALWTLFWDQSVR